MGTTLKTLIQNIARDGYGYVAVTPSAGGTTTTVVANGAGSNLDPDDTNSLYYNAWLKCESDSAGTPLNVGELRRLDMTSGYVASTGTLTTTRAFSNNTTTTQGFGIYMGLPPDNYGVQKGIKTYINDVLRRLFYHEVFLLTLVTDGDMETSGVTNWTASDLDTDLSIKSTTTGVTLGSQSLRVKNSAANGYFQAASVNVEPNEVYLVAADVTVVSGTATLELYDVTGSASVDTVECEEKQTRRVWLSTTLPDDCRQVAVRLKGTEATADVYWDNVTLLNAAVLEMSLPSWFVNHKWFKGVSMWWPGPSSSEGTHSAVDAQRRFPIAGARVLADPTGNTPFKVEFDENPMAGAHLIGYSLRPYGELSADTDSTDANADWVKTWALYYIFRARGDESKEKRALEDARVLDAQHQAIWEGKRFQFRDRF